MTVNLRGLREKAGKTQAEVAGIVGCHQSDVARYEQASDRVPFATMLRILDALGVSLEDAVQWSTDEPAAGANAGNPYWSFDAARAMLLKHADTRPDLMDEADGPGAATLHRIATAASPRPKIGLFGPFDAGKSTLINTLLGERALAASYTPATSVVTYIRHLRRRPEWLRESVLMLDGGFNPDAWQDQEHVEAHAVVKGDLGTLRTYGTHDGNRDHGTRAAFALVFLDRPILESATLIDLPGFENDTTDSELAKAESARVDLAIYVSPYTGFMQQGDIARLASLLKTLPSSSSPQAGTAPLVNLFVVASHAASTSISDANLDRIFDGFADRAWRTWSDGVAQARAEELGEAFTRQDVRKRCFPFWADQPKRRDALVGALTTLLGGPQAQVREQVAAQQVGDAVGAQLTTLTVKKELVQAAMVNAEQAAAAYAEGKRAEPKRLARLARKRASLLALIDQQQTDSRRWLRNEYDEIIDVDAITKLIEKKFDGEKKQAQKEAAGVVHQLLQDRVSRDLTKRAKLLTPLVDEILDEYEEANHSFSGPAMGNLTIPFDPRGAFIGGLAGLASVGALAAWASTLGNLGAYIIAAKAVSLLSALGISISGGTATATAALAAIGGPITVAVAIVVIFALAGWALFGRESWERTLAKRVVKQFEKVEVKESLGKAQKSFWTDTREAVNQGLDSLEQAWREALEELRRIIDDAVNNRPENERRLASLAQRSEFFASAPWPYRPELEGWPR